jgi:hypothetical protein
VHGGRIHDGKARVQRASAEIKGIRRYRHGYLLMIGKGGLTIPSRCLDERMRGVLRRLVAENREITS